MQEILKFQNNWIVLVVDAKRIGIRNSKVSTNENMDGEMCLPQVRWMDYRNTIDRYTTTVPYKQYFKLFVLKFKKEIWKKKPF